ncbi:MAG: acetate kinase [Bacteroidales bacterium]|nr:acetate kinase [Bacteroidales bacterium]
MNVLVLNCGSSSIKYQLREMSEGSNVLKAKGIVEKIGLPMGDIIYRPTGKEQSMIEQPIPDHTAGMDLILKALVNPETGVISSLSEIDACGHRVAHGGEYFSESVLVDDDVKAKIQECCALAPLHNPANLNGIVTMEKLMPGVPQVAVFDTSFHQTIPEEAYTYSIPSKYYREDKIRRYGFHGTSHKYVAEKACKSLGWDITTKKIITCHLGNGASVTAIKYGKSVDTSMGFTPVSGVTMGTRTGDIDAGALLYIFEKEGYSYQQANDFINKKCGLLGISEKTSDFRDLADAANRGDKLSRLALKVFFYTIKRYVGAYAAVMDGVDLIIVTGGIGENNPSVREEICGKLSYLGITLDNKANLTREDRVITTPDSKATVMVVATDEELVIATDTARLAQK